LRRFDDLKALALRQGIAMLRVLIADDQTTLRSAVRFLLEHEPDTVVVGEAPEAISLLAKARVARPNLVLLDWELSGLSSTEARRQTLAGLHACSPELRIIVLSGRPEAAHLALAAGADYFVSKADPPEALLSALQRVKQTWSAPQAG
jgi:DNA-binding NarL/FixJ family response regulator